jgi:hypothetical protein
MEYKSKKMNNEMTILGEKVMLLTLKRQDFVQIFLYKLCLIWPVSAFGSGFKSGTEILIILSTIKKYFLQNFNFLMLKAALFPRKLSSHLIPFYVGSETETGMHDGSGSRTLH